MLTQEYPSVLKKTEQLSLLRAAHCTPVSEEEARRLVFSYLDEDEVVDVRFTSRRGYCKYKGGRVELLLIKDQPTVGNTLHEVAHALVRLDAQPEYRPKPHGKEFVRALDGLLVSEQLTTQENSKKGGLDG